MGNIPISSDDDFPKAASNEIGSLINSVVNNSYLTGTDDNILLNSYSCSDTPYENGNSSFHFRGTSLGGFLVLESWIVPSLFYQFLGATKKFGPNNSSKIGLDSYTFCIALGKEEANRQLRRHWKTWVTEHHIKKLSQLGADTLRIPVADWMFDPYEPFIGCWDGALEALDIVLGWCEKYGITAILDMHGLRGSQNGYDNSGRAMDINWSNSTDTQYRFDHWNYHTCSWIGDYNLTSQKYISYNESNLNFSLNVLKIIAEKYANNQVIKGIEPVNEPWPNTPLNWLKNYYWRSYTLIRDIAPHWIILFQNSFREDPLIWVDFLPGCANYAIDFHIYQAWDGGPINTLTQEYFISGACNSGNFASYLEAAGVPVVVGEWSLATDTCAMWLNGFQDNMSPGPAVPCDNYVPCAEPYMGYEQPDAPPDPNWGPEITQDPTGTGHSYVSYGMCPIDSLYPMGNDTGPSTPLATLGLSSIYAYDYFTHGNFFWNFRTENEPRWSYLNAVENGWLPGIVTEEVSLSSAIMCAPYLTISTQVQPKVIQSTSPIVWTSLATILLILFGYLIRKFSLQYRKKCTNYTYIQLLENNFTADSTKGTYTMATTYDSI